MDGAEKNKKLQELQLLKKAKQVDFDFFNQPFAFAEIKEASANHLFGNGGWKKEIKDAFGNDIYLLFSKKYGNKPIDFPLAKIILKKEEIKYFDKNDTVQLSTNIVPSHYTGSYVVINKDNEGIVIMKEYRGTCAGKILNQNKRNGAERKLKEIEFKINNLIQMNQNSDIKSPAPPSDMNPGNDNNQNKINMKKTIITIAVLALLAFVGYKVYQKYGK